MSVVASFVAECARSGRWVRGVMALHSSIGAEDASIGRARLRLASSILRKHWCAALPLIRPEDVQYVDDLARLVHECSMCAEVPADVFDSAVVKLLTRARGKDEIQTQLFLSATKWTNWHQATRFFTMLDTPGALCRDSLMILLMNALGSGSISKQHTIGLILSQLKLTNSRHIGNGRRDHLSSISAANAAHSYIEKGTDLVKVWSALRERDGISTKLVMSLARAAIQGERCSWKLPLSIHGRNRVVGDSTEVLSKMIAICCPQHWRAALGHFVVEGRLALWLASRYSWEAGLVVSKLVSIPRREKYDILCRCAIPLPQLRGIATVAGAKIRLSNASKRSIAVRLASGYTTEELQLSAFAKVCQKNGDWETSLSLFHRVATEEFQQRAVQCILAHCPGFGVKKLLQLVNEHCPANTWTTSMLVKHSDDWVEALYVLRHVMARGTRCNPQILSAFMDVQPPVDVVSTVVRNTTFAGRSEGIMRRLEILEISGKSPQH
ncbi:uncharacterized protein TEOVI_000398000 [Trypanosoma equiperdum]|nr:hypothetical protein, conserved [Trypanosoma brucei gambiense DAL972]CBH15121.1 hypothetical protein, conserved [Trypanosoma brucei gambiense DAL972]SCU72404.1 hypothetical protein, conserved [Trypanosoma equiperdum]|eukprot:XP_011777387.1 hypothetical protein, conserved [Trypanosoma brucei gambiense DAL972]